MFKLPYQVVLSKGKRTYKKCRIGPFSAVGEYYEEWLLRKLLRLLVIEILLRKVLLFCFNFYSL